ncbi:prolyl oligopeptidase family serine peptidase, partial [bacterium]|nr:prolyl oligopeptidase family serine peptidase [bacterium]
MKRILLLTVFLTVSPLAAMQVVSQSNLTFDDADPSMQLTLDHLSKSSRWMGVPPRQLRWSPDSKWIYFRWRENPSEEQQRDTDPWYRSNKHGTRVTKVSDDEAKLIPANNIVWSTNRGVAAWSNQGTLFVWSRKKGTRAVYTTSARIGGLDVASDGSRVFFSTAGLSNFGTDNGDLWAFDLNENRAAQIAVVFNRDPKKDGKTDAAKWLRKQQTDLIEFVAKRKRDQAVADSINRIRSWETPQGIPIQKGERARNIRPSPDGQYLTFLWVKDKARDHRTGYMEFVNETGYATKRDARPKVGEPLADYKMGVVRVDASLSRDSIKVAWVDDGVDKKTIIHGPYWSPTGSDAVVQILSMDHKDRWIAKLDIETGTTTVIDHQHEDAWIGGPLVVGRWAPGFLQWLPDGSGFGFASTATGWAMLYLADLNSKVTQLTDGEWEVRNASLSPDGKTWNLVTSKEHPGEEHLYQLPARGGELVRITLGEGIHRPVVSPDGKRVATLFETPKMMPDLYMLDNRTGASKRRVTKSGTDEFYRYKWANSEIISFPDKEGNETWAEVWDLPAKQNRAAVVYAHGCGECAQAVNKGWTRISSVLYANYMRQLGYTMASIDYRGSSGYGHKNRTYAYRGMGIRDIDSGLPLLDILGDRYGVDKKRIGVYGGSYGGFYTLMSLFRHPGKYAAGVALYPVTDWAHYNQGYTSRILNGSQLDDEEAYKRSSPVYYAQNLQDALQIQHGLVDGNVQIQDSFRLSQMLMEM